MPDVSNRTREKIPGKVGQFAVETRTPAGFELPAAPSAAFPALARRAALQEQLAQLAAQVSVESAHALSAMVKERFPTARYIGLQASDGDCDNAQISAVIDADSNPLAEAHTPGDPNSPTQKAYWDFVDSAPEDQDPVLMAATLGDHDGSLDPALTQVSKTPRFGVNEKRITFVLDLEALEQMEAA